MTLKDLVAGFREVATASVADAVDSICDRRGYLDHSFRPRINDRKIVGPAVTVLEEPADKYVVPQHQIDLIDEAEAGSVIVVAAGRQENIALWGGLVTAGAHANGIEAAVVDGAVRDIAEIRRDYDFPVFSRSISPATSLGRLRSIASNVPVDLDGITINPGDIVVGDIDGIVIVPRSDAAAVLEMARDIDVKEAEQSRLIAEARSLRAGLAKYGRL